MHRKKSRKRSRGSGSRSSIEKDLDSADRELARAGSSAHREQDKLGRAVMREVSG